jgi:hypothetical protein
LEQDKTEAKDTGDRGISALVEAVQELPYTMPEQGKHGSEFYVFLILASSKCHPFVLCLVVARGK